MVVHLIYDRIAHHAAHSGYDLIAKYVHARPYVDGLLFGLASRIGSRRLARIRASQTPWYSKDALRREIAVCAQAAMGPARTIFHWLYAENDVRLCPQWRWRWNNRFVASFHQPPEFLAGHIVDESHVRGLDAVIVMAESQVPFMSRFVPRNRVFHVPHGVDTRYWQPDPAVKRRSEPTFLFVGTWLRDREMAKATIKRCAAMGTTAKFRIVTPPDSAPEFAALPGTTVMSGIPDDRLLEEYRSAHALFLPLSMATANNSILEAMSCGTAVISTKVGGTPEYVPPACGVLVAAGDVEAAAAAIARCCRDRGHVEALGKSARERAEALSWDRIGAMQDAIYRRIRAGSDRDADPDASDR